MSVLIHELNKDFVEVRTVFLDAADLNTQAIECFEDCRDYLAGSAIYQPDLLIGQQPNFPHVAHSAQPRDNLAIEAICQDVDNLTAKGFVANLSRRTLRGYLAVGQHRDLVAVLSFGHVLAGHQDRPSFVTQRSKVVPEARP